jgi:squalene-hopene/tetraprenyl-beta-curcumene cyclase
MSTPQALLSWLAIFALSAGCGGGRGEVEVRTSVAENQAATTHRSAPGLKRIDAAMASAAEFLVSRQSADGAWRSDVYGPFNQGDALTATVLAALLDTSGAGARERPDQAIDKATQYLVAMVGRDGAIQPPEHGISYPVYIAAGAVSALARQDDGSLTPALDAWLTYLRQRQLSEPLGWRPDDGPYGGWGYAAGLPRKPAAGVPLGNLAEPNLSATVFALAAMRRAGVPADDPAIQRALAFVERCQNFSDDPDARDERLDDGGFHFIDGDPVRNKAGVAGTDRAGRTRFASYGSATADGLRALVLCGLPPDDPRVVAAWAWLERHFVADAHPGRYAADREGARPAVYYYYCHSLVETLAAAESGHPTADANRARWARAVADALVARQRPDGSWKNAAVDVREDDPLVATSLAASALARCRELLVGAGRGVADTQAVCNR